MTGRSDRFLGSLLLVFFLALYLLTGGGHGYSPDGEFAYYAARSISLDPEHEYLKKMRSSFSQWGFMVPLLAQPLVLAGEPLANAMPQKDHAVVDGRDYVLGIYKARHLPEGAPTAGPNGDGVEDRYVRTDLKLGPATSLSIISFLSEATGIPQDTQVAEIVLVDVSGDTLVFPIRAGVETAEWRVDKVTGNPEHHRGRVASIWPGNTTGRNYYAEIPFGRTVQPKELTIRYVHPEGHLFVRSIAFLNQETGAFEELPSENRMWSERENNDLFARLFYSPFNGIVTAIGCVLLFALARLLGYGQLVSLVATLLYGVATLAWPYAKYDFSEPTLVMFILLTLYLLFRWEQDRRDRWMLLAGISALSAVGTKYFAGVLVPLLLLEALLIHWRQYPTPRALAKFAKPAALFCAPFVVVAAPAVWYLSQRFGYYPSILEAWAGIQRGWLPLPMHIGLGGLLFSPGKSFFLYSPPTVLAIFSAVAFVRRYGIRSIGIVAIVLVYFLIYSKKPAWHAGAGWGPRYQVLIIPLVILMAMPIIQKAVEERHRLARYAVLATLVLGVSLQLLAVSKAFENYIGMFRHQIVTQMPDEGAQYGGAEYYPYAAGLDDGNNITATVLAWPFSPILAHTWLLSADFLAIGPSFLQPEKDRLLVTPPWKKFWGIDVVPAHPEHGLGFDFWSMRLRTDFPSYTGFLTGVAIAVLLLEAALVASGALLVSLLFVRSTRRPRAVKTWIGLSCLILLLFNGIHLLL
ncbi:MAG: ArnT family glycosyltransferase [Sphingomonadaceae bacterium]